MRNWRTARRWIGACLVCFASSGCLDPKEEVPAYNYGESARTDETGSKVRLAPPWTPERGFRSLDADGDGGLVLAEFVGKAGAPKEVARRTAVFGILDRDHDGSLTLEEFKNKPREAVFREIDLSADGGLDFREFYKGDVRSASVERAQRVFAAMDRNGDRKISFEELRARPDEAWFHRMDFDENLELSMEEYTKANPHLVRNGHVQRVFAVYDRNGNGRLELAEYVQPSKEVFFLKSDVDGDGRLSFEEYAAWSYTPETRASAKSDFDLQDSDRDGRLTLEEFKTPPRHARFQVLDANGDSLLSLAEYVPAEATRDERANAEKEFKAKDRTNDGTLTLAEYLDRH